MKRWHLVILLLLFWLAKGEVGDSYAGRNVLNTSSFVVIGEGLAAGMGDFSLTEDVQQGSFPSLLAGRFNTKFHQRLMQFPGVGNVPGMQSLPAIVPGPLQTTVLVQPSPIIPQNNLAVPNFTLADSLSRRPVSPLIQSQDPQQTVTNLILQTPETVEKQERLSQQELAVQAQPTFVIIELGYYEAIEAALKGDDNHLPDPKDFRANYEKLTGVFQNTRATVLLTTIPNPTDTAYFSSLETVSRLAKIDKELLRQLYGLKADDLVSLPGLLEIGYQLMARDIKTLQADAVLSADKASKIQRRVIAINTEITALAQERGYLLYDLHNSFKRIKQTGVRVKQKNLNGDFLGGFFLLNGFYPSRTGHALIANEILQLLNEKFAKNFSPIDLNQISAADSSVLAETSQGPNFTEKDLQPLTLAAIPPLPPLETTNTVGFIPATTLKGCKPPPGVPGCGLPITNLEKPLVLPSKREQIVEINKNASYYGDALRVVDCPDDKPWIGFEKFPTFGTCGNLLFGGLAMADTNLQGKIRIKFSEPENDMSHFEITHPGGLFGDDGTLEAPKLFRLPFRLNVLRDVPNLISSGDLDLNTGQVTNLQYFTSVFNTALWSLISVNPNIPKRPLAFPGPAGSVTAKFEQRKDGNLDLTLAVNGFLPLGVQLGGDAVRFPLPLCSPDFQCASIVTRGVSLHPHIHLSTKTENIAESGSASPVFTENTVQEFTVFAHNNSFGDVFNLNNKDLGGAAVGRSHLLGRLQIQFGKRFGDSLPVSVTVLPPGGLLIEPPAVLMKMPKGIPVGFLGFDEVLQFSKQSYPLSELSFSSDPMNISLGAVNVKTGRFIGDFLHRGFVLQKLIFNLFETEPCTPRTSFCYQGPAAFEMGSGGNTIFRFDGQVRLPYPEGYKFPAQDGKGFFIAGSNSKLDPFLRIQALRDKESLDYVLTGESANTKSSTGQDFSYAYDIPCVSSDRKAKFTYVNHTLGGNFQLTALSWVNCTKARSGSSAQSKPDTVTFTGTGIWRQAGREEIQQVSAQIFVTPNSSYIGIRIGDGGVSNVNTKPKRIEDTYP